MDEMHKWARKLREAQRHKKEKGEKFNALKKIEPYIGDFYVLFHKTELEKVGINPRSSYGTPLGIYTYPLTKEYYGRLMSKTLPFKGESEFTQFLKIKEEYRDKVVVMDASGEVMAGPDIYLHKGLRAIIEKYDIEQYKSKSDYSDLIEYIKEHARLKSNFQLLWYGISLLGTSIAQWRRFLLDLGIVGVIDLGSGMIHPSEPTQAVVFSKDVVENFHAHQAAGKNPNQKINMNKMLENMLGMSSYEFKKILQDTKRISMWGREDVDTDLLRLISERRREEILKVASDNVHLATRTLSFVKQIESAEGKFEPRLASFALFCYAYGNDKETSQIYDNAMKSIRGEISASKDRPSEFVLELQKIFLGAVMIAKNNLSDPFVHDLINGNKDLFAISKLIETRDFLKLYNGEDFDAPVPKERVYKSNDTSIGSHVFGDIIMDTKGPFALIEIGELKMESADFTAQLLERALGQLKLFSSFYETDGMDVFGYLESLLGKIIDSIDKYIDDPVFGNLEQAKELSYVLKGIVKGTSTISTKSFYTQKVKASKDINK
jgi:hypothetical protein